LTTAFPSYLLRQDRTRRRITAQPASLARDPRRPIIFTNTKLPHDRQSTNFSIQTIDARTLAKSYGISLTLSTCSPDGALYTQLSASQRPDTSPKQVTQRHTTHLPPTSKMPTAGLKTIIALSFVLAVGFLLVILSCALWKVYYPLLVVATYVLAPIPNWICSRCANPDDFVEGSGAAVLDLGRFCTGFLVVMGIALPVVLAHSNLIQVEAMVMSIIGGLLIYGTIISFGMFFQEEQEF
ncbi:vacuolar protein sorting 55, partial [Colletotrichum incanum]